MDLNNSNNQLTDHAAIMRSNPIIGVVRGIQHGVGFYSLDGVLQRKF